MARKSPESQQVPASIGALKNPDDCPIEEDLEFQRITWAVERGGWVVMAIIVVAALAGLLGGSARDDARDGSGRLQVSYQHFQRHLNSTDMELTIETQGRSLFEVTVDEALSSAFEIRTITPQPIEMQSHNGGLLMKFAASPESTAPARIVIVGVPTRHGGVTGGIGLLGETAPAQLEIFIYP